MKHMEQLKDMLCKELEEITSKGELTAGSLDTIDKLTHSIKSIETIMAMGGYSRDDGYSMDGNSYARRNRFGQFSRNGSHDSSYDNSYNYSNAHGYSSSYDGYSREEDPKMQKTTKIVEELMAAIAKSDPKLYDGVMRKVAE